jgi:hypothetical protein
MVRIVCLLQPKPLYKRIYNLQKSIKKTHQAIASFETSIAVTGTLSRSLKYRRAITCSVIRIVINFHDLLAIQTWQVSAEYTYIVITRDHFINSDKLDNDGRGGYT